MVDGPFFFDQKLVLSFEPVNFLGLVLDVQIQNVRRNKMKATKNETKNTKELGFFRTGTALGDLARVLSDRKPHKLSVTLAGIRKRHKTVPSWRGYGVLRTVGKSKRAFSIVVDRSKDMIQLKGGAKRPGAKKATPKPAASQVSAAA